MTSADADATDGRERLMHHSFRCPGGLLIGATLFKFVFVRITSTGTHSGGQRFVERAIEECALSDTGNKSARLLFFYSVVVVVVVVAIVVAPCFW